MTMLEFERLSELEKLSLIMESGVLVCRHAAEGSRIFIYRFDTFFVSASYTICDDQLIYIHCFERSGYLPGYRQQLVGINPAEREYNIPEL